MNITQLKDSYTDRDASIYGKKNIEDSIAMLYHENSKLTSHSIRILSEKIEAFNTSYTTERFIQPFKCYPGHEIVDLSVYEKTNNIHDLLSTIRNRRSVRNFDKNYKLSLNELSLILYHSYGITHESKVDRLDQEAYVGMRNIPAAGGLYPLEIYIVLFHSHIGSGLYHYRPDKNILEKIKEGNFITDLSKLIQTAPYIHMTDCAAIIITTGMIERVFIKYGDRGYRFLIQESGALGLMMSLLAESIQLGSCILGGYQDDLVNTFLGIDGVFETINNVMVIGKKLAS